MKRLCVLFAIVLNSFSILAFADNSTTTNTPSTNALNVTSATGLPQVTEEPPFTLPLDVEKFTVWTRVRIDFPKPEPRALLVEVGAPIYEAQMADLVGQGGRDELMLWFDGAEVVIGGYIDAPPQPMKSGPNSGTLNERFETASGTVTTSLRGSGWPRFIANAAGVVAGPEGGMSSLLTDGAILNLNKLSDFTFESDPRFPLTFRLVFGQGMVYLCGHGRVTGKDIDRSFGNQPAETDWVSRLLKSQNTLTREGAAQTMGWLKDRKWVKPLIEAMTNPAEDLRVRRSAIEAIGRIHDPSAVPNLEKLSSDSDSRLSAIAKWSLQEIRGTKGSETNGP